LSRIVRAPLRRIGGFTGLVFQCDFGSYSLERAKLGKLGIERFCFLGIFRVDAGTPRLKLSLDPIDVERGHA